MTSGRPFVISTVYANNTIMTLPYRISLYGALGVVALAAIIELPHAKHFTQSSLVAKVDVPTMTKDADVIMTGTVGQRLSTIRKTDSTGEDMVYTRWQITPDQVLKGQSNKPIIVWTAGGQYLTTIVDAEDQPTFVVGQHVLVFLQQFPGVKNVYRTVGEFQGKFSLSDSSKAAIATQDSTNDQQPQTALEATISENLK